MNIKYDNSMYSTNPPSTVIDLRTPEEVLECEIAEQLDEENYYIDHIKFMEDVEKREFMELINYEPNQNQQPI